MFAPRGGMDKYVGSHPVLKPLGKGSVEQFAMECPSLFTSRFCLHHTNWPRMLGHVVFTVVYSVFKHVTHDVIQQTQVTRKFQLPL
jgi:hypothetical protein